MKSNAAIFAILAAVMAAPLAAQDTPPEAWEGQNPEIFDAEGGDSEGNAPTRVLSAADLGRIAAPKGIGWHWIAPAARGPAKVSVDPLGRWMIEAGQTGPNNAALEVSGWIREIGPNYFELLGTITMKNAPDAGRACEEFGNWRFEITQNRKYYRLRRFEWCDSLTDYIDLYF